MPDFIPRPGALNLITDVPGISVGNAADDAAQSGVTVLRCDSSCIAAVDVRGGAPGTRETEVLSLENLVGHVDAIALTGGSVFGLAAADGVVSALSEAGIGLRLNGKGPAVPIVPAAVLYDLANGGDKSWGETPPYRALGVQALHAAKPRFELGSVGAGRGAMAGAVKGGLGSASLMLDDDVTVGALVAANPVGSVFANDGEAFLAWPYELNGEFGDKPPPAKREPTEPFPDKSRLAHRLNAGANTTLAIVATDARLTNSEAKRVAIMAQDGIARAVRPAHTAFDGDVVFAVSTSRNELPEDPALRHGLVARIGAAASDCLSRAIARAVYEASRRN